LLQEEVFQTFFEKALTAIAEVTATAGSPGSPDSVRAAQNH
jgi:hypothetical protein